MCSSDLLIEKYEKLDSKSMTILQASAVIGQRFSRSLLEKVSGLDEGHLEKRIPMLEQQGFLSEIVENIKIDLMIGSPRLGELIYDRIPVKTRQKLHEEVGKEIENSPASEHKIAQLAHHYFQSGNRKKAMQYLIAIGDMSEKQYAYQAAIKHYEKALELAQHKSLQDQLVHLYQKLGHIHSLSGQHDLSLEYYQRGLQLTSADSSSQDLFHRGMGIACYNKGEFGESKKHFEILLDHLRNKKQSVAEELPLMACVHIATGEHEEAEKLLKEALELIGRSHV